MAALDEKHRMILLEEYLKLVEHGFVEQERSKLLEASRRATPAIAPLKDGVGYSWTVERLVSTELEFPLFDFSAPAVDGAEVSLQTYTTKAKSLGWQATLGAGAAKSTTLTITERATFTASAGEGRRVFLRIPAVAARVMRVATPGHNEFLGRDVDSFNIGKLFNPWDREFEVTPISQGFDRINTAITASVGGFAPAVRPLSNVEWRGPTTLLKRFGLQKEPTHTSTYEYTEELSHQYSLKAEGAALGLKASGEISLRMTGGFTLKMALPGGHEYRLNAYTDRPGISWDPGA